MYNEGGYGQKAVEKLLALTKENDICVVDTVSVSVGQKEPSFTSIVDNLYKKGNGAKVIYFLSTNSFSYTICFYNDSLKRT